MVRRGEIWLVALDPTIGSEIKKTRPCVIVSPDDMNETLRTLIVTPMTTGSRATRFRVPTRFRGKDGLSLCEQTRMVSRQRLLTRLGKIDHPTLSRILGVLREMFME